MRFFVPFLAMLAFALSACKNETADGTRWDQIAADQNGKEKVQPWHEARTTWSNEHHPDGTAW